MDSFRIESAHGDAALVFQGAIPRGLGEHDGTTFVARLESSAVQARVEVYDIGLHEWSELFRELAANWRGWNGAKEHGSLEEHLHLSCTSDEAGHVEVRIRMRGEHTGLEWNVEQSLVLEAGQLDRLARDAATYFG